MMIVPVGINCKIQNRIYSFVPNSQFIPNNLYPDLCVINTTATYDAHVYAEANGFFWLLYGGGASGNYYNCDFEFQLGGSMCGGFSHLTYALNNSANGVTSLIANSIVAAKGRPSANGGNFGAGSTFWMAWNNNNQVASTAYLANNAYEGISAPAGAYYGYNSDTLGITLTDYVPGYPIASSPLLSANVQPVSGYGGTVPYTLKYDANWNARSASTPAIGPWEPVGATGSGATAPVGYSTGSASGGSATQYSTGSTAA